MAKITTRPAESAKEESDILQRLQDFLSTATGGAVSTSPNAKYPVGTDIDGVLENIEMVFEVQRNAGAALYNDLVTLSHEHLKMSIALAEAMDLLHEIMDVSYDDALDHATADLMDAITASGLADSDADGKLTFDSLASVSKSDLKPILREALLRWVDIKIQ